MKRNGLLRREPGGSGRPVRYTLTYAGQALVPIISSIGALAARRLYTDPTEYDGDRVSLLWRMHHADNRNLAKTRTIVQVILTGVAGADGWLDIDRDGMTACREDQGEDVDPVVQADRGQMYRWRSGIVPFRDLVNAGARTPLMRDRVAAGRRAPAHPRFPVPGRGGGQLDELDRSINAVVWSATHWRKRSRRRSEDVGHRS